MLIIDKALRELAGSGRPICVGMVGAGFMGRGVALQIATAVPGMRLVAIANRHLEPAQRAYAEAAQEGVRTVERADALHAAIAAGRPAVTEDWRLLCDAPEI